MAENINISKSIIEKAKIVSTKIQDIALRKRAFALNIIASVVAEYIAQTGIDVDTQHSLYKSASFSKNLELADIYINGIRLDVRLSLDGKTFCIPKIQEKYDAKPYAYVVVKLSKDLSSAEILGYIPTKEMTAVESNTEYLPYDVSVLRPIETLRVFLSEIKQEQQIFSTADHEKIRELCSSFVDGELSDSENVYFIKHVIACPVCREAFCEFDGFDTIVSQVKNYPELLNDSTLSVLSGNKKEVDEAALANMALIENAQETDDEQPITELEETTDDLFEDETQDILQENEQEVLEQPLEEIQEQQEETPVLESADDEIVAEELPPVLPMGALVDEDDTTDSVIGENKAEEEGMDDFLLDLSEEQEEEQEEKEPIEELESSEEADLQEVFSNEEPEELSEIKSEDILSEITPELENTDEMLSLPHEDDTLPLLDDNEQMPLLDIEPEKLEEVNDGKSEDENEETLSEVKEESFENADEDNIYNDTVDEKSEDISIKEEENERNLYKQEPVELVYDDEDEQLTKEENQAEEENIEDEPDKPNQTDADIQALLDDDLLTLLSDDNKNSDVEDEEQETNQEESTENGTQQDEFSAFDDNSFDEKEDQQEEQTEVIQEEEKQEEGNETIESLYSDTNVPEQDGENSSTFELDEEPVSEKTVKATKKIIAGAVILVMLAGGAAVSWFFNHSKTQNNASLETANQDGEFFDLTNDAVQKENQAPALSQDINKSMANSFSDKPAAITITKLSWQVSEKIAAEASVKEYLQTAGKNIQMNLQNDLANSADINFNNIVKVSMTIAPDNTIKGMQVLESSGSDQIDEIVLRSIKNTLKYVSVPKLKDYKSDYFLTLIINF